MIEKYECNKIFLSTESEEYFRFVERYFGEMLCSIAESFRSNKNSYLEHPRDLHRYLLGRDILVETLLLSKADALLCGGSNVSETAVFFADGKSNYLHRINNGINSKNLIVAKYLWFLKSLLPKSLGGFE